MIIEGVSLHENELFVVERNKILLNYFNPVDLNKYLKFANSVYPHETAVHCLPFCLFY